MEKERKEKECHELWRKLKTWQCICSFVDILRVFRYYILRGTCQNERDRRETAKGGLTDFQ